MRVPVDQTRLMTTQLDLELAALRARRRAPGLMDRLRRLPILDRRSIRDPDERDAYWANVQRRLAESDAAFILAQRASDPPSTLIG